MNATFDIPRRTAAPGAATASCPGPPIGGGPFGVPAPATAGAGGRRRRSLALAFAVAVALPLVAVAVTHAVPALRSRQSFLPLVSAVVLAGWFGGIRATLLAALVGGIGWAWVVAPPRNSLWLADPAEGVRLALFVAVAVLVSGLQASRKRAEAELRRAQERLVLALDVTQTGVWDCDLGTGEFWASDGLYALLGRPAGDGRRRAATYEEFLAYTHPEDRGRVVRAMTGSRGGTAIEHRVVCGDGAVRWVKAGGRLLMDAAGHPDRLIGVMTAAEEPLAPPRT